jgi:hypothetical protein
VSTDPFDLLDDDDRQVLEDMLDGLDEAEIERLRHASRQLRRCIVCGTEFTARHGYARLCSPRCRQRASRARRRAAA